MVLTATVTGAAWGQGVVTQEEALAQAVPGAIWDRRTAYLSEQDLVAIAGLAHPTAAHDRPVVSYYLACQNGIASHVAYFEAHPVRTLPEVLMVVVGPDGRVERVAVLKFSEPPEYRAPEGWLRQFVDHGLDDALSLKQDIDGMTGATLTANAVTDAVRRLLALHAHLDPFETGAGGAAP
jgi:Na+-translocating ferredoxin:NAD+ oxidoreductase RnfG subunit